MKTKNIFGDIMSVLNFACILFTITIIGSFFVKLAMGNTALSLTFIGQLLAYILILSIGVLLCFTDVILKVKSTALRISCIGATIYTISLIYLNGCSFNPVKNPAILALYTVLFIILVFLVSDVFIMYQKFRETKYSECITQFQNKLDYNKKN